MKKVIRIVLMWVLIIGSAAWAAQDPDAFFEHVSVIAKAVFAICARIVEWFADLFADAAEGAGKS